MTAFEAGGIVGTPTGALVGVWLLKAHGILAAAAGGIGGAVAGGVAGILFGGLVVLVLALGSVFHQLVTGRLKLDRENAAPKRADKQDPTD